jgi:hypothetical protein
LILFMIFVFPRHTLAVTPAAGSGLPLGCVVGEGSLPWRMILQWGRNDQFVLAYNMPRMFYLVPKSVVQQGFDIPVLLQGLAERGTRAPRNCQGTAQNCQQPTPESQMPHWRGVPRRRCSTADRIAQRIGSTMTMCAASGGSHHAARITRIRMMALMMAEGNLSACRDSWNGIALAESSSVIRTSTLSKRLAGRQDIAGVAVAAAILRTLHQLCVVSRRDGATHT